MYVAGLSVRRVPWSWLAPGRVCGGPVPLSLSLAGMCSPAAVQLAHHSAEAADSKRAWSESVGSDPGTATARPHPDKGSALQPHNRPRTRRPTSVCAGQHLCGAPRRNRTGDPILTMEPPGTAVRTALPQVALDRWGRSDGFSFGERMRSLSGHAHRGSAKGLHFCGCCQSAEQYGSSTHSRTAASAARRTAEPSTSARDGGIPRSGHTQAKAMGPGGAGAGPGSPCPSPSDPAMNRCPPGQFPARCSASAARMPAPRDRWGPGRGW